MSRMLGLLALVVVGVAVPAVAQFEEGLPVGTKAPVVTVADLEGNPVDFAAFLGKKPAFIEFWASWCERCAAMLPRVKAAYAKFGDRVEWIGVNVTINQSKARVRRYLQQEKPPFRTLWDDKGVAVRAYDAFTTSYMVIVDRSGTVIYSGSGGDQDIDTPIAKALAGAGQ